MRQYLTGSFKEYLEGDFAPAAQINLWDAVGLNTANASERTSGLGLISQSQPSGPQLNQKWTIQSFSITARLVLVFPYNSNLYGKFGKIIGGMIVKPDSQNPTPPNVPYVSLAQAPPPDDQSLVESLWDPSSDSLPPVTEGTLSLSGSGFSSSATGLPISFSIVVPVPIQMVPGVYPEFGIWMFPSLYGSSLGGVSIGTAGLVVFNARWNMAYDDGQ